MITIDEKHPDVIAYRAGLKDFNDAAATLAKKKEALNNATQRYMAQKTVPRSKIDREADEILSGMGHSADWISAAKLEELSREIEVWETIIQRQRDTLSSLRARYSAAVCQQKDVQERYIAIQRDGVRACADVAAYNKAESQFFDELNAVGAVPCYWPMRVSVIGLPADPNSLASFHRREVERYCPEALA
jgi:predicted  nucleic acid-binding Zn-ribbon protein